MMQELKIGNKTARIPIIKGGMGVGVSRSKLAGAVAAEGGIGVISSAQIGYDEEGFETDPNACNLKAIEKHVKAAKKQANGGLVGVNIMVALKDYKDHVKAAAFAGADLIISGAGLPVTLPELTEGFDVKIAPIVSTEKAARILLKMWDRKYQKTADLVIVEGPDAGGHLGFSPEELSQRGQLDYDLEIRKIIRTVGAYAEKFDKKIPVVVAGGISSREDVLHALSLGADGIQAATKFVATRECDANAAYKEAYIKAQNSDAAIIKSPVGMPGRALHNDFLEKIGQKSLKVKKCYGCLESCSPHKIPYCITDALIRAVKGDVQNGLIFCGANVGKITKISTVREVMKELTV